MSQVEISEMMESGAHFGHQTKRWNPKMRQYIYGTRSGVHIIDLQKTKGLANTALELVAELVSKGKQVLFVGTKQAARNVVKEQATRCKMHYVNQRWMGGTLTNFNTIKNSINKLIDFETRRENNDFEGYTKKELLDIDRTIIKLEASLGGIKHMKKAPDLVFVIDPKLEHIAVREANKLGLPVIAITDSNCDPEPIDHVIPANDDAIASIEYFVSKVADACLEGLEKREQIIRDSEKNKPAEAKKSKRRVAKGTEQTKTKKAYVSKAATEEFEDKTEGEFSAKAEEKAEDVKKEVKKDDSETSSDTRAAV